jgi:NitT/TauT family transport system substrate-binding protein
MNPRQTDIWSRRQFLGVTTWASTAVLVGLSPEPGAAEPPPETKTIRLIYDPDNSGLCYAPVYIAGELLRGEGFTDVRYVKMIEKTVVEPPTLVAGLADMSPVYLVDLIAAIDEEMPVVVLATLHGGCQELVATDRVRTIRDLKGKKIGVTGLGAGDHLVFSSMLAYIGMDPRKDVEWVADHPLPEMIQLLAEGKIDAVWAFPPTVQQMRTKKIGQVILKAATDPPWSQYACCMVGARREFVQKYPVATKRALRAILKANQLCTWEPERTARLIMDKGFNMDASYPETLQTLKDVSYTAWRDYDPEAALLFHALRLRETGYLKNTPKTIIARGTDWRFLKELKKELKG